MNYSIKLHRKINTSNNTERLIHGSEVEVNCPRLIGFENKRAKRWKVAGDQRSKWKNPICCSSLCWCIIEFSFHPSLSVESWEADLCISGRAIWKCLKGIEMQFLIDNLNFNCLLCAVSLTSLICFISPQLRKLAQLAQFLSFL